MAAWTDCARVSAGRCISPTSSAVSSALRASLARASRTRRALPGRLRSARGPKSCTASSATARRNRVHSTRRSTLLPWKLPVIFVMENNGYNAVTTSEQEDANAANGEPLAVKAKAYSMPGVTVDGGDPLAVYTAVGAAVERARGGAGPTLVESKVYRLSAHGNIIAPPGVPLHYPEHEAITVFGKREEYEAALRGDPVPRFRATLVKSGTLAAAKADEIGMQVAHEMAAAVTFAVNSPFPKLESALDNVYA